MMQANDTSRPIDGPVLKAVLNELAIVSTVASGLRDSLKPISDEEITAGAEPLTNEQIRDDLEWISHIVRGIALSKLGATPEEWLAANDALK